MTGPQEIMRFTKTLTYWRDDFDFRVMNERNLDYSYVVSRDGYNEKARDMVRIKANQVLLFLEILQASLECERTHYKDVFSTLEKKGVAIPDVARIRKGIIGEFVALSDSIGQPSDVQGLVNAVEGRRDEIREYLCEAYRAARA